MPRPRVSVYSVQNFPITAALRFLSFAALVALLSVPCGLGFTTTTKGFAMVLNYCYFVKLLTISDANKKRFGGIACK